MNDNADNTMMTCANCGKGEESSCNLKACVACKLVKYCNRECQIAHRPLHKKACKRRAAELHDEALFKEPPRDDCPICFLPLPLNSNETIFKSCCGKIICNGCIYAMGKEDRGRGGEIGLCAFCREPASGSGEEEIKRVKKCMDADNAYAVNMFAGYHYEGLHGFPQDIEKSNELYLKAGELGCAEGYCNLGISYDDGDGVEVDKKKAKYFFELAAMNGNVRARHNLGSIEYEVGNYHRAYKHFILSAKAGCKESLDAVKAGFMKGFITKDEYANTLRAYHTRYDETKSEMRERAQAHVIDGVMRV